MKYQASCHCAKVAVEFEGDIEEVVSCHYVRCVQDIDLGNLPVKHFNGRAL